MPPSEIVTTTGQQQSLMLPREEPTLLDIIAAVATNPNVDIDRIRELVALKERTEAREAEKAFNAAMARLQPRLPVIEKRGRVAFKETKYSFARYEDIDDAIRPLLCAEGFSLSFDSTLNDKGQVVYTGTLAHAAGHSKHAGMILPADTSGAKNGIQAIGSTVSYAKRYLVGMLLNIITREVDDDGNTAEPITNAQALDIRTMLDYLAMTPAQAEKFWAWAEVPSKQPEQIQRCQWAKINRWLSDRVKAVEGGKRG
jgi:hypothetical protein